MAASQPATVVQAGWSFPVPALSYGVTAPGPSYAAPQTQHFQNNMALMSNTKDDSRKFFLDRAVYDLVAAYPYLALTDQKLLGWYLGLSPEYRKIIQDEGGLHQFLQRHPALKLSSHTVYVKYESALLPTVSPSRHEHVSQPGTPGAQAGRCELDMHASNARESGARQQAPEETLGGGVCLDTELEQCMQRGQLWGQVSTTEGQSASLGPLQSDWSSGAQHQYHSGDCTDGGGRSDGGSVQGNCTKEGPEGVVCGDGFTADHDEATSSSEGQRGNCSMMEDDESILVCLGSKAPPQSAQCVPKKIPTCNTMVGTEPAPHTSTSTQSEAPETADKHVITEVHMTDLEYLAGELIKLKTAQGELRRREEEETNACCEARKECESVQRAQRAELRLLALQYSMCSQHCWRLHCASAEGDASPYRPKDPPANILSVLQKLESDYAWMKERILAGVPLEHLKPLSVESERILAGARFSPAQIVADVLGNLPARSSGEEVGLSSGCQDNHVQDTLDKRESSKAKGAVMRVAPERGAVEAWYDAEEDLQPAGRNPATVAKDASELKSPDEAAGEEAESPVLCVSNLPSNVTESDVTLWFEKHGVSEVSISALKGAARVAIVMLSGSQSAEAAVKELNGLTVEGRTLHVKHINGAAGESQSQSQSQASASASESSQHNAKPHPPKTDPSSTDRKTPLSSSIRTRKVVCISPSAKGTCVPQHYGTMGSFDTLMAELTRHHPGVGRQRMVDALMELRAKHKGALSSLPLPTIREMASELLTRPETATQ